MILRENMDAFLYYCENFIVDLQTVWIVDKLSFGKCPYAGNPGKRKQGKKEFLSASINNSRLTTINIKEL